MNELDLLASNIAAPKSLAIKVCIACCWKIGRHLQFAIRYVSLWKKTYTHNIAVLLHLVVDCSTKAGTQSFSYFKNILRIVILRAYYSRSEFETQYL